MTAGSVRLDYVLEAVPEPGRGIDARQLQARAAGLERAGVAGIWSPEAAHDPFLALALAAAATTSTQIGTGIAIAFAKSPMHLAYTANDLQLMSGGRFVLGLGTQVRAHIERRFGGTWLRPAARMRETILALRAIWDYWNGVRDRLDVEGEFTRHTLMPDFFNPGPNPFGPPLVYLAAVGPAMTEVAGEVADGICLHTFTSARYLAHTTLPALERGRARSELAARLEVYLPVFVVTGGDSAETDAQRRAVTAQLAFYASTPSYRRVLETHGWGHVGGAATELVRAGRWDALAGVVDDAMLDTFAIVAPPDEVGDRVHERFGGIVDRVSLTTPAGLRPDTERAVVAGFTRAAVNAVH